ncbi:hypothetical protein CEXT_182711 [Caerostris extrusa]|uniref:Uncharacterized protein n=1 Tax=Caerostris extrusa TaxID=172846 RepID=A0AAV4YDS6_CAEEX|nr:hypothetical protein CEXT_182711 [Caerostris extrusa]
MVISSRQKAWLLHCLPEAAAATQVAPTVFLKNAPKQEGVVEPRLKSPSLGVGKGLFQNPPADENLRIKLGSIPKNNNNIGKVTLIINSKLMQFKGGKNKVRCQSMAELGGFPSESRKLEVNKDIPIYFMS